MPGPGKREEYGLARKQYEEALALFEGVGHQQGLAKVLYHFGTLARAEGDPARARDYFTRSQSLWRELGDEREITRCSAVLADLADE